MSSGAPCGACKFLRRKCVKGCIFAPYFGSEQGAARFAAVHKIFGASNVSKLLQRIPVPKRCDAVLTISYEAQARISDPVYGCVSTIFALQQQVASLQNELAIVQAQLANSRQQSAVSMALHQQAIFSTAASSPFVDGNNNMHSAISIPGMTSCYGRVKEETERFQGGIPYELGIATASSLTTHMQGSCHQIDATERTHNITQVEDEGDDDDAVELQAFAHALLHSK